MTKKITIEITEENTMLAAHYGRVRGLAGETTVSKKALTAATMAANKVLSDLFKGDKEFQDFIAAIPESKPKVVKAKPAAAKVTAAA
jgi:hypothetical protein